MKYTGPIYRPPIEANTPLLQVTVGCSRNKCSFCTMYKDTHFSIESIEQIERDLEEARIIYGSIKRIFLLNADAFVLNYKKLKAVCDKIVEHFPEMETITMYASIKNIKIKKDEDLEKIRALRIDELWVGVETGNDEALKRLNKGHTVEEAENQLERLNRAGIKHNMILMLGTGGKGQGIQNACDTARLINQVKPNLVGLTTLGFFEGSQLSEQVQRNEFIPASELEIFEEERKLLELIDADNMPFFGDHQTNVVPLRGILPRDRVKMLSNIDGMIAAHNEQFLMSSVERSRL